MVADLGSEQALLGCLLVDPDATWGEVQDLFTEELFTAPHHRAIAFLVMEGCFDPIIIAGKLREDGKGEAAEWLYSLLRATGSSAGARSYCERLRDLWAAREARAVGDLLLQANGTTPALVTSAVQRLLALETGKARRARKLGDIIFDRVDHLDRQKQAGAASEGDSIPTGFLRLDDLIDGFRPGLVTLIAARPGQGKSALISALIDNISARGVPVGVFQLEDEESAIADRAISRRAKVTSVLLRHGATLRPEDWRAIAALKTDHPIWVDDDKSLHPRDIAARMRRMKREHGCRVFFIDHLGEMQLDYEGKNDSTDQAIGRALRLLRKAAHDLQVALVCAQQLNRDIERRSGGGEEPRLSDLRGSGDLEAIARQILFVVRPENQAGRFLVTVAKNTNGPLGRVYLSWLEDYMAVQDAPPVA